MYAKHFSDEELTASAQTKIGCVEAEIRICRMRLARALAAELAANNKPELEEIIERDVAANVGAREERKSRVRDYNRIINEILGRIESLEKTRLVLRIELGLNDVDMDADPLTPGTPDEAAPPDPIR